MSSMEEVSASTVTATATATGQHLLKLEGYKRLKGMHGNGKCFESCRFEAAGHTWKHRCYPNGDRSKNADFFSLYLVRADGAAESAAVDVHAEVELALVYHHSCRLLRRPPFSRRYTNNFGEGESWWGFGQFIIRAEELESRGFHEDDCLDVRCTITVVEKWAVKDGFVKARDVERLGMRLCKCNDDLCKRQHQRPRGLKKAFVRFWQSIVRR